MFSLCAASSMCLAQLIMPVRPPPPPQLPGGNEVDLLALLPGLVPHPQKARARTDRTQIAVEVAPG